MAWAVRHVSARGPKAGLARAGGSRTRCSPARLASARQRAARWALSCAAGPRRRRAAAREARAAVARAVRHEGGPDRKRAWLAPAAVLSAHLASAQQWRVRRALKREDRLRWRRAAASPGAGGRGVGCATREHRERGNATRVHRVGLDYCPFEAQHQGHQAAGHEPLFYN